MKVRLTLQRVWADELVPIAEKNMESSDADSILAELAKKANHKFHLNGDYWIETHSASGDILSDPVCMNSSKDGLRLLEVALGLTAPEIRRLMDLGTERKYKAIRRKP